jgi:hypothetical protein
VDTAENERRTFERFEYDGAVVRLFERKNFGLIKKFSSDFEMKDISRSGMCFELDRYKGPGAYLEMTIEIPGKSSIQMRGNVRWVRENGESDKYEVGILFSPYGSRDGYNPIRNKDRLKNIIEKTDLN